MTNPRDQKQENTLVKRDAWLEEVEFANQLAALTKNITPERNFVAQLERKLISVRSTNTASSQDYPIRNRKIPVARRALTFAIGLMLIVAAILIIPPLRAIAQEVIDELFHRAANNYAYVPGGSGDGGTAPFSTIEQARSVTSFTLRVSTQIPASYALSSISAGQRSATFIYSSPGRELMITQQTAQGGWVNNGLIGASATVVRVPISTANGQVTGEFVEGEWIIPATPLNSTANPGSTPTTLWLSSPPIRRLRWQDGNILYEIIARGGSPDLPDTYIGEQKMIALAESLR